MEIGNSLFRRKRKANRGRRGRSQQRAVAPALLEPLEERVLLAATVYQTPIDIDVSTQAARPQSISQIGMADNGSFVVIWEDLRQDGVVAPDGFQADVAFRRFNADGTPRDAQQRYITMTEFDEANVAIAVTQFGGFVAAWQQFDAVSGTYDIWYARYSANDVVFVPPTRANVNTAGNQLNPTVAISDDATGTFVIAWEDYGADATGDIAVRRFDVNGAVDAAEFYVAAVPNLIEIEPSVAINSANNEWVIAWAQGEFVGTGQFLDVHYDLRDTSGASIESGRANVTTLNDQNRPSVAISNTGTFVIAWESEQSPPAADPDDEVNDVAYRRFSAAGLPLDAADVFIAADPDLSEDDPVVAINAAGDRFVVGYEIFDPDNAFFTSGVVFQVFDDAGTLISGPSALGEGVPVMDVGVAMNSLGDLVLSYTELSDGATFSDRIDASVVPLLKASEVVVSAGPGGGPNVRVFDVLTGQMTRSFFAFDTTFRGGITVATGDLNNDTFPEIIVGVASGGPPEIRVFDGASGALISSFFGFSPGFPGGVSVAVGDVTGDGSLDVVVGALEGGGPAVRVYNGLTGAQIGSQFFAFDPAFRGGVNVAVGDTDGDGTDEIIVGSGPGGDPLVRIFDFTSLNGVQVGEILAFPTGFRGGVYVSAGDLDEDGDSEIVVGAGPGGGPAVRLYEPNGTQIGNQFFAFPVGFRGGVRVATGDVNGDTETEVIVSAGPGGGPAVRLFDPDTQTLIGDQFFAFGIGFRGGVFVAGRALGLAGEGSPLTLDPATPPLADSGPALDEADLPAIVDAAHARFSLAGLSPELLAALSGVRFVVTDLGGDLLGLARSSTVYLDDDAAGRGWFVDYSPLLDEEFFGDGATLTAVDGGAAAGRVDLLSVVLHELGHALGLDHGTGLMSDVLAAGVRRLPTAEDLDALFAGEDLLVV